MSTQQLIEPRTLKGFRDYLPEIMIPRERLMETARRVYRSYGFSPIDTPALEYLEILSGKGSDETDRQMYRFEHGGRQVGMRFDLTIPLARFAAQHIGKLGTPFKRYHIAPVWRGENTQAGRYREFVQCDFDTIGTESVASDVETALVIHDLLQAIGIERFQVRINNRQILNGLLEQLGLLDRSQAVLRAIDKLEKLGPDVVDEELQRVGESSAGLSAQQAASVLGLCKMDGDSSELLDQLEHALAGNVSGTAGVTRLRAIVDGLRSAGVSDDRYRVDVTIARGLDYYTGVVFETLLQDLPSIGSVCSGGRYDNLAGLYTKQHLPGIGASLGLDRLIAAMEQLNQLEKPKTTANVFVPFFDSERLNDYMKLCSVVRRGGYNVEFYPDSKKLGAQLKFADDRGFAVALVAGSEELNAGNCQVKDLRNKSSEVVHWSESPQPLLDAIAKILAPSSTSQ